MVLLSICGNKSIGSVIRENIPNIAIATKISAVVIGFFTADENRLIAYFVLSTRLSGTKEAGSPTVEFTS